MENSYLAFLQQYQKAYILWNKIFNILSSLRLLLVIIFFVLLYKSITLQTMPYVWGMIACIIFFLFVFKVQDYVLFKKNVLQRLVDINREEILFLKGDEISFKDGKEYESISHAYASDIDIFGEHSLFQHLNRTATYLGEKMLAVRLLSILSAQNMIRHQKAIKELSQKINFRQQLKATASLHQDSKDSCEQLLLWTNYTPQFISVFIRILAFKLPLLLIIAIVFYVIDLLSFHWIVSIFLTNIIVTATQVNKIKSALVGAPKIYKIIKNYSHILKVIEQQNFDTIVLQTLQAKLLYKKNRASKKLKTLSHLFSNLESIYNVVGAIIFNGFFLYHLHILYHLSKWKKQYAKDIPEWLDVIGEMEMISSLGNFTYNNPNYVFPDINQKYKIAFEQLGHPLIPSTKRVCNNVSFVDHSFVVLTGSNMSGKTTFLRTLGVNIVLANIGAPVCATKADIHLMKLYVSIRQTDSLYAGESYFFAEVKRLKTIVQQLQQERCFVLLDEILKGTNSEDKQMGTVGIIKKILSTNAIGCIATHDLQICNMKKEYPKTLNNQCFEVEIKHNKLVCDYKIRKGICKSKSATFLMQKMGII